MTIKEFLEANDLAESEFASVSGIPRSTLNQVTNGSGMNARTASRIIETSRSSRFVGEVTLEDLVASDAT